jgi:cytochrome P450
MTCVIRVWPRQVYEGDFYRPPLPGFLLVMNEDAIRQVMIDDADHFPQAEATLRLVRPIWREGIAASTGDAWRWQRRAATPAFTPKCAGLVVPFAETAAYRLAERWRREGRAVEITAGFADAATQVVFDAFLAKHGDETDRAAFSHWGDQLTSEMERLNTADVFQLPAWTRAFLGPTLRKPAAALHKVAARILAESGNATDSAPLLHLLASSKDPESGRTMSAGRLEDNIVGALAGGRGTTALALSWALWLIAQHRPAQDRLHREIAEACLDGPLQASDLARVPFARQVLLEAMRLYPPAAQIARQCIRDTRLGTVDVRKGTLVIIPIYALHRHRRYWTDPDVFEPERFAPDRFDPRESRYRFMPFGGGGRICLGMHFALTEAQTMLITLLREHEVAPDPDAAPPELTVGSTLRPRNGLRLVFSPSCAAGRARFPA